MKTIQGYVGKNKVLKSMLKEDLEKGNVWLIDTVGTPIYIAENESKGDLFVTTFTGFDLGELNDLEERLKEGVSMDELSEIQKIYLSINAPMESVTQFYLMEKRIGVEIVVTVQLPMVSNEKVLVSHFPFMEESYESKVESVDVKKLISDEEVDLTKLKSNQVVKAIYIPDIAFNGVEVLIYDKEKNRFVSDERDIYFELYHPVFDDGFEIYLVEYKEDYDRNDWDYSNPTMKAMEEGSSTVKLLNKKKIIQFVEIEREMTNK